jgi:hypothetical protein
MTETTEEYSVQPKFRRFDCLQGSEEWEQLRSGRPTASEFGRIVTPVRGDYAKGAIEYACEIVAQRLGLHQEPPPSFWMEWGKDHEDDAVMAYETITGNTTEKIGFVMPTFTDAWGGSPDRIANGDRILEVKCPKPSTLIRYKFEKTLPVEYRAQVQGLLWITGFDYADFFAWHPELEPFLVSVERDEDYIDRMAEAMGLFLIDIAKVAAESKSETIDGAEVIYGD